MQALIDVSKTSKYSKGCPGLQISRKSYSFVHRYKLLRLFTQGKLQTYETEAIYSIP